MSNEEGTPIQMSESCACGAEFSITAGKYASEWSAKQIADWRANHVCPLRGR